MTDTAANVALYARRNEVARFTIAVTGIDLTGVAMAMQVRLGRGVPGAPLFALAMVTTAAAEGLKLDSVTATNGVPTSIIKGRINASTMTDGAKVPYTGELGADTILAYAMTWTIGGDTQVRLAGDFVVVDSAYNSDAAPANRPASYGSPARAGGASGGALQFGDQVVHISISGVEQVAALIGTAKTEADRSAAQAQTAAAWAEGTGEPGGSGTRSAKAWAAASGISATQSAGALAQTAQIRDTFTNTAATAQAAVLATASGQYQTVSSGLAATAPNGYFYVASGGDVFTTLYQKVNGAAVLINILAGQSALDRVGRAIAAALNVDNAPTINAVLGVAAVRGALLPGGVIGVQRNVVVPAGKFVRGAGRGMTRLTAMDGFATTEGLFSALIGSAMGATSVEIGDLTCDGRKLPVEQRQLKGVVMYRARNFLVDRVEVINVNSYALWAAGIFGDPDTLRPGGVFRTVRSINANVHFECSNALGVLWDGMEYSGGDGDIGCEAVYHSLAGSRDVTYRHGRQIGPCGGSVVSVLADEDSDTTGIRLIDCEGFSNNNSVALSLLGVYPGRRVECSIEGGRLGGVGLAVQTVRADVAVRGASLRGLSSEGVSASDATTVKMTGADLAVTAVSAGAKVTTLSADTTSTIRYDDGSIRYDCAEGDENTSQGGRLHVSPTTKVYRGLSGETPIKGQAPIGIGNVVKRWSSADKVVVGDEPLGDGQFQFVTAAGATYRVRVNAVMAGGAGNTGIVVRAFNIGGDPARSICGMAGMTDNQDGSVHGRTAPLYATAGYDGASIYADIGSGKKAGFQLDFTLTAPGADSIQIASAVGGTLLAGSYFEVERVA